MYEPIFGLSRRPFAAAADSDCYFPATSIDSARQTLFRCIDRGEGAGLLIGPAGAGKSLLLEVLAEQFRKRFEIGLLANGRFDSRRDLLQAILYELSLPYRDLEEGELRLALIDHLSDTRRLEPAATNEREGLLLLIDEAHALPLKLLEEVRLITNLVRGGQPKVRLVLAGSPALDERFTNPKLDAFNQRIAARCYLQALDRNETRQYVKAQIEWAGGRPDRLFAAEALDAVFQATQGLPRLINQVCDHALLLACAAGSTSMDKSAIEEAWADLQQLPTPWNCDPGAASEQRTSPNEVIEFGVLEDEPSDVNIAAASARENVANGDFDDHLAIDDAPIEIEIGEETNETFEHDVEIVENALPVDTRPAMPFQHPAAGILTNEFGRQDPLRRLAQVEQQIAAIDSDFEPDVSYGPQVDLSFGAAFDPFNERFAEEEIVIDPFAMTAGDALANRPLVQCEEGRKLGALLKPLPDRTAPLLTVAVPGDVNDVIDGSEPDEPVLRAIDPRSPIDRWSNGELRVDDESCEPALIVIEDEPPSIHPATVVRRRQFGQLFANLRRS